MRMRKKKNLIPRMERCAAQLIRDPYAHQGHWRELMPQARELRVELGCGKGGFISQAAPSNPDINYIAVDIKNEMLVLAKRKLEDAYKEKNIQMDNVRIFIKNIEQIDNVFDEADCVDRIYINFCNPWPKTKHKKRRLTHFRQLEKYKTFLNGEIWFKTDDDGLFNESFDYFEQAGFEIKFKTCDLHNSEYADRNYITEHEKMFTDEGKKIKFLIANPKKI